MSVATTNENLNTKELERKALNKRHDEAVENAAIIAKIVTAAAMLGSVAVFFAGGFINTDYAILALVAFLVLMPSVGLSVINQMAYLRLAPMTPPNHTPILDEKEQAEVQAKVTTKFAGSRDEAEPVSGTPTRVIDNIDLHDTKCLLGGSEYLFWNMAPYKIRLAERNRLFKRLALMVEEARSDEERRKDEEERRTDPRYYEGVRIFV